ncbi:GIN domain-containing protein [Peijinzhouia sedimentorum]
MKKVVPLFIIFCFLSDIHLCAQVNSFLEKEKVTREIALQPFSEILIERGGNFYLHYSPTSKVEINGLEAYLTETEFSVSSGILRISPKGNFSGNSKIEVHIYTPLIKGIQQKGGGSIVIKEGFASVNEFKCSIDGGGKIDITTLSVNSLLASIKGGGEISARVDSKLQGKINGGGDIFYQGDPVVESNISGGGAIKQKHFEK